MYTQSQFESDLKAGRFKTMSERWTAQAKVDTVYIELTAQEFLSRTHGGPSFEFGDPKWHGCFVRSGGAPGLRRLRSSHQQVWLDGRVRVVQGSISVLPSGALSCSQNLRLRISDVPLRVAKTLALSIVDE